MLCRKVAVDVSCSSCAAVRGKVQGAGHRSSEIMENQPAVEWSEGKLAVVVETETARDDLQPREDLKKATENSEEDEYGQCYSCGIGIERRPEK